MTFKVGVTRDLLTLSGEPCFDPCAFDVLKRNAAVSWEWIPETISEITPEIAARYDALHVNVPRVTAASVARDDCRVRIVARNGVGYDNVDVPALTRKGILLTNTPVAVRRPVAVATLTMIFALAGRLFTKDKLVREGRWNDRTDFMGQGLTTRTLGLVGAGSIGQEVLRLARPFFARMIAADPYADHAYLTAIGAEAMPLDEVLSQADFVVVTALLNDTTRHMIGAAQFARMKRTAYYINMGRGPIHDEAALVEALRSGRIAGAGLDVSEVEPLPVTSPLVGMDNVILTPHALCWTDECFRDIAASALTSIAEFSLGRRPAYPVNPEVLRAPR